MSYSRMTTLSFKLYELSWSLAKILIENPGVYMEKSKNFVICEEIIRKIMATIIFRKYKELDIQES